MMSARKGHLLLALILALLALSVPAAGQKGDQIVVNNADEVRESSVTVDQDLINRLGGVGPRVVVQFGNELQPIPLVTVPSPLRILLEQVPARVVLQYANALRHDDLVTVPDELQTLLGQVRDRIMLQYANTNRSEALVYPVGLFNDATPPEISGVSASGSGAVTWTSDEYADSAVLYGTESGVYSHTESSVLYTKQHRVTLAGLTPGAVYYYQVRSTDRSGNTATSAEHSFWASYLEYLPVVLQEDTV